MELIFQWNLETIDTNVDYYLEKKLQKEGEKSHTFL